MTATYIFVEKRVVQFCDNGDVDIQLSLSSQQTYLYVASPERTDQTCDITIANLSDLSWIEFTEDPNVYKNFTMKDPDNKVSASSSIETGYSSYHLLYKNNSLLLRYKNVSNGAAETFNISIRSESSVT